MKKVIVLIAFSISIFVCQVGAQAIWGIKAGINLSKIVESSQNITFTTDAGIGFHAGVTAELPIKENLSIQSGLLFSQKGGKSDEESIVFHLNYFDLPLNLLYKHALNNDNIVVLGYGGPYIGYLVNGKVKQDNISESINGLFKKIDAGINFGAGVEISKFIISTQYGFGLSNISDIQGFTDKNRVFQISLGYKFRD